MIIEDIYDSSISKHRLNKTFRELWDFYKSGVTLLVHRLQEDSSEEILEGYFTVIKMSLHLIPSSELSPFGGILIIDGETYEASDWDEYPVLAGDQ